MRPGGTGGNSLFSHLLGLFCASWVGSVCQELVGGVSMVNNSLTSHISLCLWTPMPLWRKPFCLFLSPASHHVPGQLGVGWLRVNPNCLFIAKTFCVYGRNSPGELWATLAASHGAQSTCICNWGGDSTGSRVPKLSREVTACPGNAPSCPGTETTRTLEHSSCAILT